MFTDGSGTGWHGLVVLRRDQPPRLVARGIRMAMKNVGAEMNALLMALEAIVPGERVAIVADFLWSVYYVLGWWNVNHPALIEQVVAARALLETRRPASLRFIHVKGHRNDGSGFGRWNKIADQLCSLRRPVDCSKKKDAGLTEEQQDAWRGNRRMLGSEPDSIQNGDVVFVPHLPGSMVPLLTEITPLPSEGRADGHSPGPPSASNGPAATMAWRVCSAIYRIRSTRRHSHAIHTPFTRPPSRGVVPGRAPSRSNSPPEPPRGCTKHAIRLGFCPDPAGFGQGAEHAAAEEPTGF
jgi:hypothetical protein